MTEWVVGCPGCGTHFRVTAAHLAPAGGLVRCGSCLTVFRAEDQRVVAAADSEGDDLDLEHEHARRHRSVLDRTGDHGRVPGAAAVASTHSAADLGIDPASLPDDLAPPELVEVALPPRRAEVAAVLSAELERAQRRGPRWPWVVLGLCAAVALVGQSLFWRFDELALDSRTRPGLEQLCAVIGCAVPERSDPGAIRSQRLLVRSHPERAGGLQVDAVIVNRAAFAQAFPIIELRFSDMGGELQASRRFAPREYLHGELAGRRLMPPQAPVQISIELLDPGPDAVNYEMRLH